MQLSTSYKQILAISIPIMLGSAAQNIIVLCDNVFLYHVSKEDFAAVGLVGVFYLIIASIGYGFSRGGQILIARRHGEQNFKSAGDYFKALFMFELVMAIGIFLFLQFGSAWFFAQFVENPIIYEKCLQYIYPRSYGVFFSYLGVALVAFYTGVARTKFIIYDTLVLIVVNIFLNYVFIYGAFGFEPMGIAGAGWASTLAEVVAFIAFVFMMLSDHVNLRKYKLFSFDKIKMPLIRQTFDVSAPIVWQSVLGLGSWFIFFSLIEGMGSKELEISNLIRNIYLILSIPCWGYSTGINTLVSNMIGNRKRQAVIPITIKTAKLNLFSTMLLAIPVVIFPEFFLYPLFGGSSGGITDGSMSLLAEAKPLLPLLVIILATFAVGSTFMNGLTGTGHTRTALWIQSIFVVLYIIYSVIVIKYLQLSLHWAWGVEIFYWLGILAVVYWYLVSKKWHVKRF